jgi:hypothetical protein
MPTWKVLLIALMSCVVLGLGTAAFVVPVTLVGGERWMWLGILVAATIASGGLLALFLRHAGRSLDVRIRVARR